MKMRSDELSTNNFTDTIDADSPLKMFVWLGRIVNPEPVVTTGRGRKAIKVYNRLTGILIATGLLQEDELAALNNDILARIEDDLEECYAGKRIRFSARSPRISRRQRQDGILEHRPGKRIVDLTRVLDCPNRIIIPSGRVDVCRHKKARI